MGYPAAVAYTCRPQALAIASLRK